jgi:hypothetical protein
MYGFAKRRGVPMLAEWNRDNDDDFNVDSTLRETYDCYLNAVGSFTSLGAGINKHMELYYAWRFRTIKRKAVGDRTETEAIRAQDSKYRKYDEALVKQVDALSGTEAGAMFSLSGMVAAQEMQTSSLDDTSVQSARSIKDADVDAARKKYANAHDERLKAKAKKDSLPNMTNLQAMLDLYDRQLLADVHAIRAVLQGASGKKKRSNLRPHYAALLEAYENEFEKNNGLKDERIFNFFDRYVHDSLAAFAKDATLPSDPRVVYLGGNEKYSYASLKNQELLQQTEQRFA